MDVETLIQIDLLLDQDLIQLLLEQTNKAKTFACIPQVQKVHGAKFARYG